MIVIIVIIHNTYIHHIYIYVQVYQDPRGLQSLIRRTPPSSPYTEAERTDLDAKGETIGGQQHQQGGHDRVTIIDIDKTGMT